MGVRCAHCLLEIPEDRALKGADEAYFCCSGCEAVYLLLKSEGLDEFYRRRKGWKPGPVDITQPEPGFFRESLIKDNNTCELKLTITGIRCASCVWLIERFLARIPGIISVRVNYATYGASIRFDPAKVTLEDILKKISALGYAPRPKLSLGSSEALKQQTRSILIRFGTGAFFSMQLMLISIALYAGYFQGMDPAHKTILQLLSWFLATPVVLYAGAPFIKNSIKSLKTFIPSMDTLISLGALSAYIYSVVNIFTKGEVYFDSASMIVTLILLGRYLEGTARLKAAETMEALVELIPQKVKLLRDGQIREIPVEKTSRGDLIAISTGERIPLDGNILEGTTEIDESSLTGEATPVRKAPGDEVFAGTVNITNPIIVKVSRVHNETVLYGIIKAVEEAQARRAPIQRFADRVSGWFVYMVLLIALITFSYWIMRDTMAVALMNAIAVLVVACPCALGLATPLAILRATALASRTGLVIKGGDILEDASRVTTVFFDKTGTITKGHPSLDETIVLEPSLSREFILKIATSVEALSGHPLYRALKEAYRGEEIPVQNCKTHPGLGIEAEIHRQTWIIGRYEFLLQKGIPISREITELYRECLQKARTVVFVSDLSSPKGILLLSDTIRDEAKETITTLKEMGITPVLLSGDAEPVVRTTADRTGITLYYYGQKPVQKAEIIRQYQKPEGPVMMVGDGINDAPALVEAEVGVAMGRGTAVAMKSADVVIVRDNLKTVPLLIKLSRATLSTIKLNLLWAFSYNLFTLPLAVSGKLHPVVSAILMVISSLLVVGNSLRLKLPERD